MGDRVSWPIEPEGDLNHTTHDFIAMSIDSIRNQWTPPPGRHQVSMGGSMTRFLKQRKGTQQTKQNKAMPTSNFYQFKYNFMPESVDTSKPGVVELTTKDITHVRVERASQQSDEVHVFRGKEEPAKEVECVLIFDPESGLYTLEKLDSSLILHHEGRGPPKVRQPSVSPMPNTPSPAASASKVEDDVNAELFRELESALEKDDDDTNDEDVPLSASSRIVASNARRAEPIRPPPPDVSSGKPKPILRGSAAASGFSATGSKPAKPSPLASALPPPPVAASGFTKQGALSSDKGKAPLTKAQTIDVEEEVLEFGKPARRTQLSRISPAPASSPIALPGTSSSNGLALPSPGGIVSLPGPGTAANQIDDEDDDEWDEVAGTGAVAATGVNEDDGSIFGDGFADEEEGEEINIDQFAAEMNQELEDMEGGEEDGGDMEDIFGTVEEPSQQLTGRPMSLNQFAAGGIDDDPDDDYSSSSEESDDD
ncbi:hypothetical protein ACEPAF_6695 [Sanghuangporus sanghuang]